MSTGAPALEVGFDIVTGGSMGEVAQLRQAFNEAEGDIVRGAGNIERATTNVVKLGPAIAEFRTFGTEASRTNAQIGRSAEQMTFALNRSLQEFGKSRSELRNLRAEMKAAAADDAGLTDVAAQLRAANAALNEREQAARSAALAHAMFEARVQEGARALREEEAAAARDATALANLRAMIDPAAAAQDRLNNELAEARRLMTAAGASAEELAAAEDALWARSTRATQQHELMAGAARRSGFAVQQMAIQLPDITQGLLTGQKPMTVFIQQGGQLVQIAMMAEGGIKGFGKELGLFALRFSPVLVALAAAGAGFALFNRWINQGVTNDQLTKDLGKITGGADATKQELFKLKDETVTFADTASAMFSVIGNDVATAFVGDMKKMGKDVKDVFDDLTSYGRMALAGIYAGVAGLKSYLAEVEKGGVLGIGKMLIGEGDPKLLEKTFGAAYDVADKYLGKLGGRIRAQAVENARQRIAGTVGYNNAPPPKIDRHAEQLEREARAMEAQIAGHYRVAEAYGVSGAAALVAEARLKAETDAISKRGDAEAFFDRQLRLSIAERVRTGAQNVASMRDQAMIQEQINREVAAGIIPAQQAADLIRDRMADLPLLHAIEAAGTLKTKAGAAAAADAARWLDRQREARDRLTKVEREAQIISAIEDGKDQLALQREELRLVGATEVARVRSLAVLRAEQEARRRGWDGPKAKELVDLQTEIAVAAYDAAQAQRLHNEELDWAADRWDLIATNVSNAGRGMADAFGEAGRAIGDIASIYSSFEANRARLDADRKRRIEAAGTDEKALARANERFALSSATAQIGAFGDMTAAAKGFFDEKSKGYKALATAEKIFRGVEFAMSVRAMAQDVIETGSKLATSAARTAAGATEAVVNAIKSLPFPLNLAAGAATIGALASIGVSVGGAFGGNKNTLAKANDGTGTVLGDADAKSESLKRSIDALRDIDTLMLSSSREMASTLRSIDSQIGGVAALVVRSGNVNASGDVAEGFKASTVGSILSKIPVIGGILGGLFGTKTTVVGSGLSAGPQTLDSILNSGFDASYYSDVQKKKKLFGITTSTKYSTSYTGADAGLENQFTLILRDFASAIGAAAGPLGESTAEIERRLGGFVVNLGKIDLQGLSGEEIEEKLSAVFGAAADQMALAALPGFERFQKVGEGAFETLVRVASTVEAVTASLDMLGGAARTLGIDAKLGLAAQFDSVSDFNSAAEAYFTAYYSAAEQNAAKVSQLSGVFVSLGVTMPDTLAGFRALVEAQDLTTAAGQSTYATLLQLAPAFADLKGSMEGAKSAADILAERQDLQRKLLELNGDTAAIRALDLAKVDASNRALQEQVWAIEDAQKAAAEAERLSEAWASVGSSIEDEIRRIRGLSDASGGVSFASAMSQFNAATIAARGGDQEAAKLLPSLSQALLKSAADAATSRQELDRVQAQTAASLEATSAVIAALAKGNPLTNAGTVAAAAAAAQAAAPASTPANDAADPIRSLRDEIAALRSESAAALSAIAGSTAKTARIMEDVTPNGDAISTVAA